MAKPRDTRGSIDRMREHLAKGSQMATSATLAVPSSTFFPVAQAPTTATTSKAPSTGGWNTTLQTSPASSPDSSGGSLRDIVDVDGSGFGYRDATTPTQEALSQPVAPSGRVYTKEEYASGEHRKLPTRNLKAPEAAVTTLAAKQFEIRDVQALPSAPDVAVALVAYDGICYWYFFGTPDNTPFQTLPDDSYVTRGLIARAPSLPSYNTMSSRPEVQIRAVFEYLIQTSSSVVPSPQDGCESVDLYAADEFNRTGQYPSGYPEEGEVLTGSGPRASENIIRLGAMVAIAFFARMINKD